MKNFKKIKPFLKIPLLLIAILVVIVIQFFLLSNKFNDKLDVLTKEAADNGKKYMLFERNLNLLNEKSNEVRSILSLPLSDMQQSLNDTVSEGNAEDLKASGNDNIAYYNAVDYLNIYSFKVQMEKDLASLLNSKSMMDYFLKNNFKLVKTGSSKYDLLRYNNVYYSISAVNPKTPVVSIETITSKNKDFSLKELEDDYSLMINFFDTEFDSNLQYYKKYGILKKEFTELAHDKNLSDYLKKSKLDISKISSKLNLSYYEIYNKDKSFILRLSLDKSSLSLKIGSEVYFGFQDYFNSIIPYLEKSDKRTKEIKVVDDAKIKVEKIFREQAFISYLKQNNLSLNIVPREDNDYFYYDLTTDDKKPAGSFAVQKILGNIYLMDSEDIMISSLKYLKTINTVQKKSTMIIPENLPQITDRYSNENSTTFVVIGSHENNADTIILVHSNDTSKKITLIAIPRDLYYEGDKINDYYRNFGGEKFSQILTDITGLDISGYIAVDMYAFIDIINILGGIDVTLQADLIDPTYMVRDNGEWSTLYYKKGPHHFNGIESLRIVRSRHTSSDFGRTSRQQLVIQGIKDKMSALDITDLGTILKLFQTLENYLDTNFSSMEMLSLFIKYKDNELVRKQGLSTFNVLYNTYTNIYKLKDKSKQYEEGFYRGYWILLPVKDDWNVIKWYIRSLIEDDKS